MMEVKTVTISTLCVILLALSYIEVSGKPAGHSKSPNCPHGRCFIDRCKRICNCVPTGGNISCTKDVEAECTRDRDPNENVAVKDMCPDGNTFKSSYWPPNFVCHCNNDTSQTYECFDTARNTFADAFELAKSVKSRLYQIAKKEEPELITLK